ncbi:MAG: hypothetical protein ACI8RE_003291 [Ilumatobacter sp.]
MFGANLFGAKRDGVTWSYATGQDGTKNGETATFPF